MGGGGHRYRLRLWGEVALEPAAGPLSKRARAMLARLALEPGSTLDRHALAVLLWPERTDAQALANLRQLLHDHGWLSRGETPALAVTRDRIGLVHGIVTTDHAALAAGAGDPQTLADLLGGLTGPFLGGLDDLGEAFDEWREGERRRHADQLTRTVRTRVAEAVAARDFDSAARLADVWAVHDPCDETVARAGLAADSGRRDAVGARRRLAALTASLATALGVEPAEETRRAASLAVSASTRVTAAVAGVAAASDTRVDPPPASPPTRAQDLPAGHHRRLMAAGMAALLLVIGAGGWWVTRARPPSADTDRAQSLTLAARQLGTAQNRNAFARSADMARAAIAADPNYAPAWTELAIALWVPAWWAEMDEPGARRRIRKEALSNLDRALRLSPGLPRALAAKGMAMGGAAGDALLEQAAAADPRDADVWLWIADARAARLDMGGALAGYARAAALAPLQRNIISSYVEFAIEIGRNDLAAAATQRFAIVAPEKFGAAYIRLQVLEAEGRLGDTATEALALLKTGPADNWRVLLKLVWSARAVGDLNQVEQLTAPHPQLRKAYAAIYAPDDVDARLGVRPDAFLDDVMANAESRSLLKLGKGSLLLALTDKKTTNFRERPVRVCCGSLNTNLMLALRRAGRIGEADALASTVDRDTRLRADAGVKDFLTPLQSMALACLRGDASAARWLDVAVTRGWRGQAVEFAVDPADEPACALEVRKPGFAAARGRLLALIAAERPKVEAATHEAVVFLKKNPPVTPPSPAV